MFQNTCITVNQGVVRSSRTGAANKYHDRMCFTCSIVVIFLPFWDVLAVIWPFPDFFLISSSSTTNFFISRQKEQFSFQKFSKDLTFAYRQTFWPLILAVILTARRLFVVPATILNRIREAVKALSRHILALTNGLRYSTITLTASLLRFRPLTRNNPQPLIPPGYGCRD